MEENVALDSSKQKKFVKSIKGIKKLIKKNEAAPVDKQPEITPKAKKGVPKIRKKPRGLVYLSHIPHGFYEHQMTQYFKQFGVVTNARVIKSKRTGRSKGFAFVEFKEPSVGQIVAETMNNYLMGKRLIKAVYIPPEKQRRRTMRKHWNTVNNPGNNLRMKIKKNFNADKDDQGDLKRARKLLSNLNKTKKRLKGMGIDYDFFTPVDIPEALLQNTRKAEKVDDDTSDVKDEKLGSKKNKKTKTEDKRVETNKQENKKVKETKLKSVEVVTDTKMNMKDNKSKKLEVKQNKGNVKEHGVQEVPKINKNQQKQKENKLKESGIQHMGDFVKVGDDSENDSDSSVGFDSDEYEKMMGSDDEFDSDDDNSDDSDGNDEHVDGDIESDSTEEERVPEIKKVKSKLVKDKPEGKKQNIPLFKKESKLENEQNESEMKKSNKMTKISPLVKTKKNEQQNNKQDNTKKRKAGKNPADSPKKLKFEKQNNQKHLKKLNKMKK